MAMMDPTLRQILNELFAEAQARKAAEQERDLLRAALDKLGEKSGPADPSVETA